ncbi:MAG: YfhO family protein [Acidobacteria bacterium]|nr:YfhO family protein [Acidobacteriota bacterium]
MLNRLSSWNFWARSPNTGQAVLILIALWLVLCWPWLVEGRVVPFDSKDQFYPSLFFVVQSLRAGDSPFWNPYIYGGYPMISDPQAMLFSPLALVLMLLVHTPTPHWFDAIELLHLLMGGLGVLLLCNRLGWSSLAGLYAALVYMFGGPASARMQHVPMILAYSYFPLALLTLKEALDTNRLRWAVAFGLLAGIMAAHQNQVAYLGSLILLGYALYRAFSAGGFGKFLSTHWRVLAIAALIGVLIIAVPLYLTFQFLPLSNRLHISYETAVQGSLHPVTFLTLFVRDFFDNSSLPHYWGFNDITESYHYAGILPLVLIWRYGIPTGVLWMREFRYFLAVGIVALLYAIGHFTPFYWLAYHVLPGVAFYRRPTDATFVINMVLAMATGFLMDRLLSGSRERVKLPFLLAEITALIAFFSWGIRYAWQREEMKDVLRDFSLSLFFIVIPLGLLYAITAIRSEPLRRGAAFFGLILLAVDLGVYNAGSRLNAHNQDTTALLTDGPAGRDPVVRFLSAGLNSELRAEGPYRAEIFWAGSLWANAPMVLGIHSTQGYNPLRYALYEQTVGAQEYGGGVLRPFPALTPGFQAPMLNLLGVKYIASVKQLSELDSSADPAMFPEVFEARGIHVYENQRALPRVLIASTISLDSGFHSILTTNRMPDIDYRSTVVLDHLPETVGTLNAFNEPLTNTGKLNVHLLSYRNTEVRIAVQADRDVIVVLGDLYYPYWRVYVDGEEHELLRANYLFRGVHVTPGAHTVVFHFEPFSWTAVRGTIAPFLTSNEVRYSSP